MPGYKVAAAVLPSTVVLLTWAVLSSHRDPPSSLLATTSGVADHDDSLLHSPFTFAPICSTGSYDGPDESLQFVNGKCDIPYFVESPKPILVMPSTLAWPTCGLAAYNGTDLAIRPEDGTCDSEFLLFPLDLSTPRHSLDARTACTTLLLRVPGFLPSDTGQLIEAQTFKHLADSFGHEYCSLLTQDLPEMTCQTIGLIITLGYGLSGFLLDIVRQIPPLCPPSKLAEVLRTKVDWVVILPLLHRLVQLFLGVAISFYVGNRRLQVSLWSLILSESLISFKASEV